VPADFCYLFFVKNFFLVSMKACKQNVNEVMPNMNVKQKSMHTRCGSRPKHNDAHIKQDMSEKVVYTCLHVAPQTRYL